MRSSDDRGGERQARATGLEYDLRVQKSHTDDLDPVCLCSQASGSFQRFRTNDPKHGKDGQQKTCQRNAESSVDLGVALLVPAVT